MPSWLKPDEMARATRAKRPFSLFWADFGKKPHIPGKTASSFSPLKKEYRF
jgi:hypothetical protein